MSVTQAALSDQGAALGCGTLGVRAVLVAAPRSNLSKKVT
jgi:hypothetical protein